MWRSCPRSILIKYDDNKLGKIGAKGLIQYLRFVHSGGEDLGDLSVDTSADESFEQDIYDSLRKQGIGWCRSTACLVIGWTSRFSIRKVGTLHPRNRGRWSLLPLFRDSERPRPHSPAHLERLGWKFHRIWSTEWFRNKETEVFLATQAVQEALNAFQANPKPPEPTRATTLDEPIAIAPEKKR